MTCSGIKRRFSAYLDGELDVTQKDRVEAHLRGCESCRGVLEKLAEAWDLLETLHDPKPVPYFYTRLRARMASEKTEEGWNWVERFLIPASTVAVVILGIFVGSIVGGNGEERAGELSGEEAVVRSFYLDSFDDFPSASLGEAYFGLADEK